MAGQNRREKTGFWSGCSGSAKHRSPTPFGKTEPWLRPGQPKNFPTRTDERTPASFCSAMGGTHSLGLPESPLGSEPSSRWKMDRNHPLDWEKTQKIVGARCPAKHGMPLRPRAKRARDVLVPSLDFYLELGPAFSGIEIWNLSLGLSLFPRLFSCRCRSAWGAGHSVPAGTWDSGRAPSWDKW